MNIPFDPHTPGVEHEYRVSVFDITKVPHTCFQTTWQIQEAALHTYNMLKAAFPEAKVSMKRRTLRVEEFLP